MINPLFDTKDKKQKSSVSSVSSLWANYTRASRSTTGLSKKDPKQPKSKSKKTKHKSVDLPKSDLRPQSHNNNNNNNNNQSDPQHQNQHQNPPRSQSQPLFEPSRETETPEPYESSWIIDQPSGTQSSVELGNLLNVQRDDEPRVSKISDSEFFISPCESPIDQQDHDYFFDQDFTADDDTGTQLQRATSRDSNTLKANASIVAPVSPCGSPPRKFLPLKSDKKSENSLNSTQVQINFPRTESHSKQGTQPGRSSSENSMGSGTSTSDGSVSPVTSTFSQSPMPSNLTRDSSVSTYNSSVSKLPVDMSHPRRSFAVPRLDDTIEEDHSRKHSLTDPDADTAEETDSAFSSSPATKEGTIRQQDLSRKSSLTAKRPKSSNGSQTAERRSSRRASSRKQSSSSTTSSSSSSAAATSSGQKDAGPTEPSLQIEEPEEDVEKDNNLLDLRSSRKSSVGFTFLESPGAESTSTEDLTELKPLESSDNQQLLSANSARSGKRDSMSSAYSSFSFQPDFKGSSPFRTKNIDYDIRSLKAYSIISPVSAGVFDDEHPALRRIPTFKKRLTIKESKNKPLPAEPSINVPPLLIRRMKSAQATEIEIPRHHGHHKHPHDRPRYLSTKPKQTDLQSLDEAFRRNGLTDGHNPRQFEPQSGSSSPSLRQATQELEEKLTSMSLGSEGSSRVVSQQIIRPFEVHRNTVRSSQPIESMSISSSSVSNKQQKPSSNENLSSLPTSTSAATTTSNTTATTGKEEKSNPTTENAKLSSTFGTKKSKGKGPMSLLRMSSSNNADNSGKKQPRQSASSPSLSKQMCIQAKSEATDDEKAVQTSGTQKSRKVGERGLRLKLPKLRTTQLGAPQSPAPNQLSIVMESPRHDQSSRGEGKHVAEMDTANQIRAALSGLERLNPLAQSPASTLSMQQTVDQELSGGEPQELAAVTDRSLYSPEQQPHSAPLPQRTLSNPRANVASVVLEPGMDEQSIPATAAQNILLKIMENVDSFNDLFSLAVLNRAFYQIFKQNELSLMKGTLFRMSAAAWELREMSPPWESESNEATDIDAPVPEYTPNLYIRHYTRDLFTMVALKSLILVRCESFLRPDTVRALAGLDEARSFEVDEAFWRVWTFCRTFGCGKGREDDIAAQADWLNGGRLANATSRGTSTALSYPFGVDCGLFDPPDSFGKGNHGGLKDWELIDMMEIWTCLGALLQVFHGECKHARKFGVFDNFEIREGDIAHEESLLGEFFLIISFAPSVEILTFIQRNGLNTF